MKSSRIHAVSGGVSAAVFLTFLVGTASFALTLDGGQSEAEEEKTFEERLERAYENVRQGQSEKVTFGTLSTLESYIYDCRRMEGRNNDYVKRMTGVIEDILSAVEDDRDIVSQKRGMFWRGYPSRYSYRPQLYSIYVPKKYKSDKPIPLVVTLHGGSSNHNVWLAMNLGNKISTKDYWDNFRTEYKAKRHPSAIVVSPDGLGQVRWRWAGEQDVLDVIADVQANYNIDPDKIFLTGLSNGAIGAYTIGLKHAWRFAAVLPLAGVTDWMSHHEADARWRPYERKVLRNESAITYAENAANTHFRFFHGEKDPGFSVEQARSMASKLERLKIPFKFHEFKNRGHDLGYVLWRTLRIDSYIKKYTRQSGSADVRIVTSSVRANRQAWVVVDEWMDHSEPATVRAKVIAGDTIKIETNNTERLTLLLNQCPVLSPVSVEVDGQTVYRGPLPPDSRMTLELSLVPAMAEDGSTESFGPLWLRWDGSLPVPGTRKVAGLSGPLGDVGYEEQVHVYGTGIEKDERLLKKAAYLGARGWMAAHDYTEIRHKVIPDSELTFEMMRNKAVFLYGNGANNSVLAELGDRLPIKVGKNYLVMRGKKVTGWGVGARFVCPNPVAPDRYLVVAAGVSAEAVEEGGKLPLYLGDYIVYNYLTTQRKAFMVLGGRKELEAGLFTEDWKLPKNPAPN